MLLKMGYYLLFELLSIGSEVFGYEWAVRVDYDTVGSSDGCLKTSVCVYVKREERNFEGEGEILLFMFKKRS